MSVVKSSQRKIEIPFLTGEADDVIEIDIDQLPEPQSIVGVLTEQKCKIHLWIQIAIEYYKQGKFDALEMLLGSCLERWDQARVKQEAATYPDGDKDRIKALDLLAIYLVRRAYQTNNRDVKRDYLAKAAQKFTEVDKSEIINKHGSEYQFHLLGRAYCCLIEGRNDQAEAQFKFVQQQQQQSGEPENIPALLGRACIEYNKNETGAKKTALSLYKKAIQICPTCPADVRLGLGICFYKLNQIDKAEIAFTRALTIDPRCVGALTALAVIELNKKTGSSIKRAMDYLSRAFKLEPTNSMVLTLLADHFFYSNEHEKVIKLAVRSQENTENEAMLAQSCYQLGRAYHKQKQFDHAFEYYYKATQFGGPQAFLAHYGLGQMYILKKEYDSAIQSFETVLKSNPDNHETLKVLASLYARSGSQTKKDQAREILKKVTESHPDDLESWIELASLSEQHDTQTALTAYKTAIKLYESRKTPVLPEIYNNIAALLFSIEALDESEKYYNEALKRCEEEKPSDEDHYDCISYTIRYNIGRLYEAKHQLVEAEKAYKDLLCSNSMYIDCYLRLGCMDRDKGLYYDASNKFKETFKTENDNFEAWTLIANMHLSKLELTPCQKKFERILDRTKANPDCYSLLSVGNVWLASQYQSFTDKDKQELQRNRALSFYRYTLKYDQKNIYAANGVGCIFAAKGMYNEARDVFSQVREATADFPDVWINIAHIYVEQRQYVAAVQMYENCLKKFYNNTNTEILLYIARALFKANKMIECKKVLLRARQISPSDLVVLFNLAKVLKTHARQVFENRRSTYIAVVTAESELRLAKSFLQQYSVLRDKLKSESLIHQPVVESEGKDCDDLLLQVAKCVKVDAEQRDRQESLRRQESLLKIESELARKAAEEQNRLEEERRKKQALEIKRRELIKRQEETKIKISQEDTCEKKKEKRQRTEAIEKEPVFEKETPGEPANKRFKSRAILESSSSSSSDDDDEAN